MVQCKNIYIGLSWKYRQNCPQGLFWKKWSWLIPTVEMFFHFVFLVRKTCTLLCSRILMKTRETLVATFFFPFRSRSRSRHSRKSKSRSGSSKSSHSKSRSRSRYCELTMASCSGLFGPFQIGCIMPQNALRIPGCTPECKAARHSGMEHGQQNELRAGAIWKPQGIGGRGGVTWPRVP